MMKKKSQILWLVVAIIYFPFSDFTGFSIPCPIHFVTGLWCPGCGVTRMIKEIIKGNFKQAFYYNQLLFISFPVFLFFFLESIYAHFKRKKPLYLNIPNYIYIIYIVLLIGFMIIRNLFPFFAPTSI